MPGRLWTTTAPLLFGTSALLCTACTPTAELRPAKDAQTPPGDEHVSSAAAAGVNVVIETDAWPGAADVEEHVTPLWVRVENEGSKALRLRYDAFALEPPTGEPNRALPLYQIDGTAEAPALVYGDTYPTPGFTHSGFALAPMYHPIYPGMTVYDGPFVANYHHYEAHHAYWLQVPLPTARMRALVLPEGVIEPGGVVAGFLFFERVDPDREKVRFTADLVGASDGERFGTISIPLINTRVVNPSHAAVSDRRKTT